MMEQAAKDGSDTVVTFGYSKGEHDRFVRDTLKSVRSHRGQVCFVRLYCDRKELARRVKSSQRRRMGKIGSEKMLSDLFRRYDLDLEIPFQKSLSIDTTSRTPRSAAKSIARHYRLSSRLD